MTTITRIIEDADLRRAYPLMEQLRPNTLTLDEFIPKVHEGIEKEGYTLFALEEDGNMLALCGVQAMYTLYYDRCLWVCDLVTDERFRSRGHGRRLLGHVEEWALENGFRTIALSSGIQRKDAHRFYLDKMGYAMNSYSFIKKL